MSKPARFLPVLLLLMVGGGLCLSLLVIASDPAILAAPTQTPVVIYVQVYPTVTPVLPLPDQCDSSGAAYQLQLASAAEVAQASQSVSPDGRTTLYTEAEAVYLQHAENPPVRLKSSTPFEGSLAYQAFWSPDSGYVAYVTRNDAPLYIASADGSDNRVIVDRFSFPAAFLGWSPDSQYLALQAHFLADVSVWTVNGEQAYHSDPERDLLIDQPVVWSPDGNWLIYRWRDNTDQMNGGPSPYGFTIAAADGSAAQDVIITGADDPVEPIRQLYIWSPISQFVALNYLQSRDGLYQETVRVYDLTGRQMMETSSQIEAPVYSDLSLWSQDWSAVHWIANHLLAYTRPVAPDQFDLLLFDLNKLILETIYEGLPRPPFYPASGLGAAVYVGYERPYAINLLDETETHIPFIQNASDAGDPDWSPDGARVAAVWAAGENETRQLYLSWMRPDGSGRQDVDGGFRDVRDLRWLNEGRELAYVAWRGDEASIEIVDTASGERRIIAEGFAAVRDFAYDPQADSLSFWWTTDGAAGQDAYRPGGERVYRIAYRDIAGVARAAFWSPDGTMAAIKMAPATYRPGHEHLLLAYADGRPAVVVRRSLTGLGDPLWSPDSQLLAFTQSRNSRPVSLQVVDTNGADRWDYAPFPPHQHITWEKCG